jgi:hypothetical protein
MTLLLVCMEHAEDFACGLAAVVSTSSVRHLRWVQYERSPEDSCQSEFAKEVI